MSMIIEETLANKCKSAISDDMVRHKIDNNISRVFVLSTLNADDNKFHRKLPTVAI
jgi:hypothetical protein